MLFLSSFLYAKPMVSVSILPQQYFIEKIAGNTLEVNVMVTPGNSPATYEPKPSQMKSLAQSKLYFAIGVPFEKVWLPKFESMAASMQIVFTDENISKRIMASHHHENHVRHEGVADPHIWLDPLLVKIQAKTIAKALILVFPEHESFFKKNLKNFELELDALDETIKYALKDLKNRRFLVFHPSWGYLSDRYSLEQIAIEVEGKEPKPAQLKMLIKTAKKHNIGIVFVAPQFSTKSAETIAKEIGGKVIAIDPLAKNWKEELLRSVEALASSWR